MTKAQDEERRTAFEMLCLEGIALVLHQVHAIQHSKGLPPKDEKWVWSAVRYGDTYGNQSAEAPAYRRRRFGVPE